MERAKFDFLLPKAIEDMIGELEVAVENKVLYVDCIQDEIRSLAHGYTDVGLTEEQAEQIIDYYCRVRWC